MKHARYYHMSNGRVQQALGSDSCLIFADNLTPRGRHNLALSYAAQLNQPNGNKEYIGYVMFTGANLMSSFPEQRKVFPTSVEFIPICASIKPEQIG